MSKGTKIVIGIVLFFMVASILLVIVDRAQASIAPEVNTLTRHRCHHHPRRCKRAIRNRDGHRLVIDGQAVSSTTAFPAPARTTASGCDYHHLHRTMGGGNWWSGPLTEWVQHLKVRWCWAGGRITEHYAHAYLDIRLGWLNHLEGSTITSEWYPWGGDFTPSHNGRFEGIDSTVSTCPGLIGLTCLLQDHPWIHVHEHATGSYSVNSEKW